MGIVNCIFTVLGKPIDEKDEQVMLSFHNITKFEKWCGQLVTDKHGTKEKNLSPQQRLNLLCGSKVLRVLIFAIFAVFPAICKNKFPQIEQIFSDLNSLHKNKVLRNCVCSITSCLFHSETMKDCFIV